MLVDMEKAESLPPLPPHFLVYFAAPVVFVVELTAAAVVEVAVKWKEYLHK